MEVKTRELDNFAEAEWKSKGMVDALSVRSPLYISTDGMSGWSLCLLWLLVGDRACDRGIAD